MIWARRLADDIDPNEKPKLEELEYEQMLVRLTDNELSSIEAAVKDEKVRESYKKFLDVLDEEIDKSILKDHPQHWEERQEIIRHLNKVLKKKE